jgi:hypothetical protein
MSWLTGKVGMSVLWVLLLSLFWWSAYSQGRAAGYTAATEKAQARIDQLRADVHQREMEQQAIVAVANENNRRKEQAHEQRIADLRAEYARTAADQAARDRRTIDDLYAGYQRLRLQVTSRPVDPGADQSVAAAFGIDGDGRAELAPATAAALYSIAADGDAAIRRLTALQSWARSAVELCGSAPPEE